MGTTLHMIVERNENGQWLMHRQVNLQKHYPLMAALSEFDTHYYWPDDISLPARGIRDTVDDLQSFTLTDMEIILESVDKTVSQRVLGGLDVYDPTNIRILVFRL